MSEAKQSRWDEDSKSESRRKRKWDLDDQGREKPTPLPNEHGDSVSSSSYNSVPPPGYKPSEPNTSAAKDVAAKINASLAMKGYNIPQQSDSNNNDDYNHKSKMPSYDQGGAPVRKSGELPAHILLEKVQIDLQPDRTFPLKPRLVGPSGSYIKHIVTTTGARVLLKGKGSGYLDPATQKEGDEELHFYITSPSKEKVDHAKKLCEDLLSTVKAEYEKHLTQKPLTPHRQHHQRPHHNHNHHHHHHQAPPPHLQGPPPPHHNPYGQPPAQPYGYPYPDPYAYPGYPPTGYPPTGYPGYPMAMGYQPQPYGQAYPPPPPGSTPTGSAPGTTPSTDSNDSSSAPPPVDPMAAYYGYYGYGYYPPISQDPSAAAKPTETKTETDYSRVPPPPPSDPNPSDDK